VLLEVSPRQSARRAPGVIEFGLITGMLPTFGELAILNLVDVCGPVILRLPAAREAMPGENDRVMIVR